MLWRCLGRRGVITFDLFPQNLLVFYLPRLFLHSSLNKNYCRYASTAHKATSRKWRLFSKCANKATSYAGSWLVRVRKPLTDWLRLAMRSCWKMVHAQWFWAHCAFRTACLSQKAIWQQTIWKIAKKVIRFGQNVALHRAPAVMIHTVMFTALVQAAMDEQWIEVPNLGTEKKTKLFPKLGPYWMSFTNLYLDVDEDGISDEETEMDEDIEGMQFDNSNTIMVVMKRKMNAVSACWERESSNMLLTNLKKGSPTQWGN